MNNLGLLSGNVKGDVVVTIQMEPQSLIMLFILIIAAILVAAVAHKIVK